MTRRLLLAGVAALLLGGTVAPALAGDQSTATAHTLCVLGSNGGGSPEGICVSIPTH